MDIWALNLKAGAALPVFRATRNHDQVGPLVALRLSAPAGWIEVGVSARRGMPASGCRSALVRAFAGGSGENNGNLCNSSSAGGNNDPMVPQEGDGNTKNSHGGLSDWRDFRANLVAWEQEQLRDPDALSKGTASPEPPQKLGLKWAHPIPVPETGCLLLATEKLDGMHTFKRTVILLLKSGSRGQNDGPSGIILNRPLRRNVRHMKPSNSDLATPFADCSVHFGGPVETNTFLVRAPDRSPPAGFIEVVSGVCYGGRNSLHDAALLIEKEVLRPMDVRFYLGYAYWQFDQLLDEIKSEYWVVAACSSRVINEAAFSSSSVNLWQEVLQLMGGQYADMSRRPREEDGP